MSASSKDPKTREIKSIKYTEAQRGVESLTKKWKKVRKRAMSAPGPMGQPPVGDLIDGALRGHNSHTADPDTLLASVCDIYAAQDGAKVPAGCPAGKPSIVPGYNWLTWQEGATLGAGIAGGLIGSAVIGAIVYSCCKKKRQLADPIMSNPFLPAEGP